MKVHVAFHGYVTAHTHTFPTRCCAFCDLVPDTIFVSALFTRLAAFYLALPHAFGFTWFDAFGCISQFSRLLPLPQFALRVTRSSCPFTLYIPQLHHFCFLLLFICYCDIVIVVVLIHCCYIVFPHLLTFILLWVVLYLLLYYYYCVCYLFICLVLFLGFTRLHLTHTRSALLRKVTRGSHITSRLRSTRLRYTFGLHGWTVTVALGCTLDVTFTRFLFPRLVIVCLRTGSAVHSPARFLHFIPHAYSSRSGSARLVTLQLLHWLLHALFHVTVTPHWFTRLHTPFTAHITAPHLLQHTHLACRLHTMYVG